MKRILSSLTLVVALCLTAASSFADSRLRPRAEALVAVSWAAIEVRLNAEPDLPGPGPRSAPAAPGSAVSEGVFKAATSFPRSFAALLTDPLQSPGGVTEAPAPRSRPAPANLQVQVSSPIAESAASGVHCRMVTGDWCKWCNHEEICKAAERDGLQDLVIIEMVGRNGPWPYDIEGCPTFLFFADGKIVDRMQGRTAWPVVREKLLALANRSPKAVSAIRVGTVRARPQIQQLIQTMKPLLGTGGSLSLAYKRAGTEPTELPLGDVPIRIASSTSITWSFKGEDLAVAITPPIQAKLGGWIQVAGAILTPERVTLDLPWLPDVALSVTE